MEENTFYQMYLRELQQIKPCTKDETEELAKKVYEGNSEAGKRLIEGTLSRVLVIAQEYEEEKVALGDLIQEGNMALTMAVAEYPEEGGDFLVFAEKRIREAMEAACEEEGESDRTIKRVVERVEMLNTISEAMAKELGREASLEELAEKMQMPEDEVKDIMKMALDALTPKQ